MMDKIIIVGGDPNSINSEIIFKTWRKLNKKLKKKVFVIANLDLLTKQFKRLKFKVNLTKINNFKERSYENSINVFNIPLKFNNPFNVSKKNASKYVIQSINFAHYFSKLKISNGFINCPINKQLIKTKKILGVTELISLKNQVPKYSEVMMLYNKKMSVVPITTHENIKNISKKLTAKKILVKVKTIDKYFKKLFRKKPRIAVLGLNPHNDELSQKSEEVIKILPAIKILKKSNIIVKGPFVADTFFVSDYKNFDVVVGMYHDQVLIPFKTLFKFDAINITLGLKYLRISPDHGTAINLIGKNKANYKSLLQCVKFINRLS